MKSYVSVPDQLARTLPDEAFMFPASAGHPDAANAPNMIRERRGMGIVLQSEFLHDNQAQQGDSDYEAAPASATEPDIGQFDLF